MAKSKRMMVLLDSTNIHFARNVRENAVAEYDSPDLRDDLALNGQLTPAYVLKLPDGTYEPIRGNRRVYNMKKLRELGVIDPKTAKRDPETGAIVRDADGKPIGGKVFEYIEAEVFENLTERERVLLMIDSAQDRALNKMGLQRAFEFLFETGSGEREATVQLKPLLEQHYPPSRTVKPAAEDNGVDLLNYYRGAVQVIKMAWRCPDVVRNEWYEKLKTGRSWPKNAEMKQAFDIFTEEQSADKTGKINQLNPGPKLLVYWQSVVKKYKDATAANGGVEKAVKASAMMSRKDYAGKSFNSRSLILFRKMFMGEIGEDRMIELDRALLALETGEFEGVPFTKDRYAAILDSFVEETPGDLNIVKPSESIGSAADKVAEAVGEAPVKGDESAAA